MSKTKIEWADKVWNPIVGCTKCSPGCVNCYAERMAKRLYWMGMASPSTLPEYMKFENGWKDGHIELCEHRLEQPLKWHKPRRIFVCSMSDLFHPKVPFDFIDKVHAAMIMAFRRGHYHTYLILTKRIKRMLKYYLSNRRPQLFKILEKDYNEFTGFFGINWPFPKAINYGVSISNQAEADEKIPVLLQIPAAVRWLSIEPMLGLIDLQLDYGIRQDCTGEIEPKQLDWVVVGCESGPKRRPCKIEWVQSIVEQCKAAGVKVFVKQISINGKVVKMPKEFPQEYPERR